MIRPGKSDFDRRGLLSAHALSLSKGPAQIAATRPQGDACAGPDRADGGEPASGRVACAYLPRVSALHDGELSGEDSLLLCAHVQSCRACREMLAFLERVSTTFSAADAGDLLRLAPRYSVTDRVRRRNLRPPADVRWARRLTAVAAFLFLAAVGRSVYVQYWGGSVGGSGDRLAHPVHQVVPDQTPPTAPSTQPAVFSRASNDG